MSRGGRKVGTNESGLASHSSANECSRCGNDMVHTRDMTKTGRGRWVHKWCASGADDE